MAPSARARELVGIVPAAGQARRLGRLPGSKELLPVGFRPGPGGEPQPITPCEQLLERLRAGGVERAFVVLRPGKWDLPAHLAGGGGAAPHLAYLVCPATRSLPESLDAAYPFVREATVALGFPDVLFAPADAFARLHQRLLETAADLVLGLFPVRRPETTDLVELDGEGRVVRLELRPRRTALRHAWLIAVWGPAFTEQLHAAVARDATATAPSESASATPAGAATVGPQPAAPELQIGTVVRQALEAGLEVRGVELPGASYRDLGTPEELRAAWRDGVG